MSEFDACIVKSFKHNGQLHRLWRENWLLPQEHLLREHQNENMYVVVNYKTPIEEADGKGWVSKIPAVSFFIPNCWFNVVALIEQTGIRYYCNIASPPYFTDGTLTYIDYDLDVILTLDGEYFIVDEDEYEEHKRRYRYSDDLMLKIEHGLQHLLDRIKQKQSPFNSRFVKYYFSKWMELNDKQNYE